MPYGPYFCPKCGESVLFKRFLTMEEAAYLCNVKVTHFLDKVVRREGLRLRFIARGKGRYTKIVDSADVMQYLNKKYLYREELHAKNPKEAAKFARRMANMKKGWATSAAKRAALKGEPTIKPAAVAPASSLEGPQLEPEDEAPEDQSGVRTSHTESIPSGRDTPPRPLK